MALNVYELGLTGNGQAVDYNGKASATRTFVVDTISQQAALEADGIPALNSQHPTLPNLILDAIDAQVEDGGICRVVCRYSNSRQFGSTRTPNKDAPRWYHWGWASRVVQIEVPIAVRALVIAKDQFGAGDERLVWKIGRKIVNETRIIRPLQVRVQVSNVRDLDVIAQQKDRLHVMPDGNQYHFEGATVNQVDDNGTYDISYIWELDEGTFNFPPFATTNARYCVQVTGGQSPEDPDAGPIFRNPYTVFVAYQIGDPSVTIPNCELNALYPVDANGWRQLPGANRII
jgi:hypothetical protein